MNLRFQILPRMGYFIFINCILDGKFRVVLVLCSLLGISRLHFQGKCSVIKALDLRVPPKLPHPRRTNNDAIVYPTGLIRKKSRTQSDPSKIWIRELKESLKTPFSFNENKKVDEIREDNERYVINLFDNITNVIIQPLSKPSVR